MTCDVESGNRSRIHQWGKHFPTTSSVHHSNNFSTEVNAKFVRIRSTAKKLEVFLTFLWHVTITIVYDLALFFFQALSTYSSVPQISAQLHFLKAQVLLASGEPVEIGLNLLQTSLLSSPVHSSNAWQVLVEPCIFYLFFRSYWGLHRTTPCLHIL